MSLYYQDIAHNPNKKGVCKWCGKKVNIAACPNSPLQLRRMEQLEAYKASAVELILRQS